MTLATTAMFRRRWLVFAVLTAISLRALVPVGFMPVAAAGGVAIGFCPGDGAMPPGVPMVDPHRHAAPGRAHHSGGAPGARVPHAVPCVFAASATVAGTPSFPAAQPSAVFATPVRPTPFAALFSPTIVRAQSARGPPIAA